MTTTDSTITIAACTAEWDNCDGEVPHRCTRPMDHPHRHECECGARAEQCGSEYAPERRDRRARIVRCDRAAGHDGDHEELYTTVTWPQRPEPDPTAQAIRAVARRVLVHIVAACEVAERWEDYPEIGEDDWTAVAAEVRRLAGEIDTSTEQYESAYRHLAGRAERSQA